MAGADHNPILFVSLIVFLTRFRRCLPAGGFSAAVAAFVASGLCVEVGGAVASSDDDPAASSSAARTGALAVLVAAPQNGQLAGHSVSSCCALGLLICFCARRIVYWPGSTMGHVAGSVVHVGSRPRGLEFSKALLGMYDIWPPVEIS